MAAAASSPHGVRARSCTPFRRGFAISEVTHPKRAARPEKPCRRRDRWPGPVLSLYKPSGALLTSFEIAPQSTLAGEIRPGLLLVGLPPADGTPKKFQGRLDFLLGGIAE